MNQTRKVYNDIVGLCAGCRYQDTCAGLTDEDIAQIRGGAPSCFQIYPHRELYAISAGGQLTGPSINGPYTQDRLNEIIEFESHQICAPQPGAIVEIIDKEDALALIETGQYNNYSDLQG